MRINTRLNRIELTKAEQAVLDKADDLTRLLAKHGDDSTREEANKAGFHIERLKKALVGKLNHQ